MDTNGKKRTKSGLGADGFTLIELMIVVAIIGIIASIAVPSFMRARVQSNQAAAIGNLRVISQAENTFNSAKDTFGNFAALTSAGPPFLDPSWQEGVTKLGYTYSIADSDVSTADFICYAEPQASNKTGNYFFRVDATGQIRRNPTQRPSDTDEVVGN